IGQAAARHLQRSAEERDVLGGVSARLDDFAAAAPDLVADRGSAAGNDHRAADEGGDAVAQPAAHVGAAERPAGADHDFAAAGDVRVDRYSAARHHFDAAAFDLGVACESSA